MGIEESLPNIAHVPRGTVCFQCIHGDSVQTVEEYSINNMTADSVDGVMVVNDTLVVVPTVREFSMLSHLLKFCPPILVSITAF